MAKQLCMARLVVQDLDRRGSNSILKHEENDELEAVWNERHRSTVCVSSLFYHSIQIYLRRKTFSNGQNGEDWTVTIFKMQMQTTNRTEKYLQKETTNVQMYESRQKETTGYVKLGKMIQRKKRLFKTDEPSIASMSRWARGSAGATALRSNRRGKVP